MTKLPAGSGDVVPLDLEGMVLDLGLAAEIVSDGGYAELALRLEAMPVRLRAYDIATRDSFTALRSLVGKGEKV